MKSKLTLAIVALLSGRPLQSVLATLGEATSLVFADVAQAVGSEQARELLNGYTETLREAFDDTAPVADALNRKPSDLN